MKQVYSKPLIGMMIIGATFASMSLPAFAVQKPMTHQQYLDRYKARQAKCTYANGNIKANPSCQHFKTNLKSEADFNNRFLQVGVPGGNQMIGGVDFTDYKTWSPSKLNYEKRRAMCGITYVGKTSFGGGCGFLNKYFSPPKTIPQS
jgi:hypothetical protein